MSPGKSGRPWRRAWRWITRHQWQLLGVAWLFTLAFGYWALSLEYAAENVPATVTGTFYRALRLFTMGSFDIVTPLVWQLEVARLLAPLVVAFTFIKTLGLLLAGEAFRLRQHFASGHVVVCGLGQRGLRLATGLRDAGHRVVVVERDQNDPLLESCREAQIATIVGDATEGSVLRAARADSAGRVIAVCGEDTVNAEIAAQTAALTVGRRGTPLQCFVHIVDPQLWQLLRERELGDDPASAFRLEFFNIFESGARAMLREFPAFGDDDAAPHVLIVGLGQLGEHVALRVAWEWRRRRRRGAPRMKLTVIDRLAGERCAALADRHSQLAEACDLRPLAVDVCSPAFERCEFLMEQQTRCGVTMIYVCLDDDTRSLSTAMTLHRRTHGCGVPIVVRMGGAAGLADLLGGQTAAAAEFADIHAFSLLDRTCQTDLVVRGTHETLARALHDVYVGEQTAAGHDRDDNPLVAPWEELSPEMKESNRRAADHIRVELAAAGYTIAPLDDWDADLFQFSADEVETMAALEHERWIEERKAAGWQYAAGPRDLEGKTSPYLVPWGELPEEVKDYDRATVRRLPALLAEVGLQVRAAGGEAHRARGDVVLQVASEPVPS
jgi:hypothetical protein